MSNLRGQPCRARHSRPVPAANGEVDRWVRWAVTAACLVTFLIAVTVPRVLRNHGEGVLFDSFWFKNGLALEVIAVVGFAWIPVGQVSRSVRLAVVLPILHLGLMVVAWVGWDMLASRLSSAVEVTPVLHAIPLGVVFAIVGGSIAIAGWWIARSRRGEAIHAIVMIALVDLLLVGLWLPIVSWFVTDFGPSDYQWAASLDRWERIQAELASPARLASMVLLPPLVVAIAYTAVAIRRRHWLPRMKLPVLVAIAVVWVVTIYLRRGATDLAAIVYSNFVPWLLAAGVATIAAICTLSIATWLGGRLRRSGTWRQHTGRLVGERGELIAGFEITSWLRGPRAISSACEVVTDRGTIPVPAGARLVAPLPLSTTLLRTGERVAVLRAGDEVGLGGYEQHATGQPFRDSGAPVPGDDGVQIGPTVGDDAGQLALAAWRPCIAYLVIMVTVAVPALVTALQPM